MQRSSRISLLLAPIAAVVLALGMLLSLPGDRPQLPSFSSDLIWPVGEAEAVPASDSRTPRMVELTVKDVIPIAEADTHAVVLVSRDDQTVLPIFVTEEAAVSIAFRLANQDSPHPLAADLLDDVVAKMGGTVTEVQIDGVNDDIYTSHVLIRQGGNNHRLTARPSDAIALALTGKAKIFVAQAVLSEAGIARKEIDALRDRMGMGGSGDDPGLPDEGPERRLPPSDNQIEL